MMSAADIRKKHEKEITSSEAARKRVYDRFIAPYEPLLGVSGYDGISQKFDKSTNNLIGLHFPGGYNGGVFGPDVSATHHEMGHFITVSENRAVRRNFGFGGGLPLLGMDAFDRIATKPTSGYVEAKAMAWEIVLMRDLHGCDVEPMDIAKSLTFASDFMCYPGSEEKSRIAWAAELIEKHVGEFGTVDDFERLWVERCEKLPELFRLEDVRQGLYKLEPVKSEVLPEINSEWSALMETRSDQGVTEITVSLSSAHDPDGAYSVYQDFSSEQAALKWVAAVRASYPDEEPELAMGM